VPINWIKLLLVLIALLEGIIGALEIKTYFRQKKKIPRGAPGRR